MPPATDHASELAFTTNGIRSDRRSLVLIHGAGGCAADWPFEWREPVRATGFLGISARSSSRWFDDRCVYSLDLPGHGRSAGPACDQIGGYSKAVSCLIGSQAIERPILVGHSMGGAIALEIAATTPELVAGLVILGSAARLPVTDAILDGLSDSFEQTVAMIVQYCWARGTSEFYRTVARRRMREAGSDVVRGDFLACNAFDGLALLSKVRCPVHVVAGSKDRMVPVDASRALADNLPNATFAEVADGGHFFHVEKTAAVTEIMRPFAAALDN